MSIKDSIVKMIKLTDQVEAMNKDIKEMTDDLRDMDRRLVRIETIVEFAGKNAINRQIKSIEPETE